MEKSVFKVFFSKHKERIWLDSLGEKGWLLKKANDARYTFEISEDKHYSYSLEYLPYPCESAEADEYFASLERQGVFPVLSSGRWIYLASESGNIDHPAEEHRANSKPYLTKAVYCFFFAAVFAIVCGYQFYAIGYLDSVGYDMGSQAVSLISSMPGEGAHIAVLNVMIAVLNFFIRIINGYFELWFIFMPRSAASAVISVVLPVTVITAVLGALNFSEYLSYRSLMKKAIKDTAVDKDAEQDSFTEVINAE